MNVNDKDEIESMKPGAKLDTRVAEKVMGFKRTLDPHQDIVDLEGWDMGNGRWSTHFQPSTDISATWEVVEKLKPQGIIFWYNTNTKKWIVATWVNNTMIRCDAKTAPEAICKAALLALEEAQEN